LKKPCWKLLTRATPLILHLSAAESEEGLRTLGKTEKKNIDILSYKVSLEKKVKKGS
jgi:hypothetical protein